MLVMLNVTPLTDGTLLISNRQAIQPRWEDNDILFFRAFMNPEQIA